MKKFLFVIFFIFPLLAFSLSYDSIIHFKVDTTYLNQLPKWGNYFEHGKYKFKELQPSLHKQACDYLVPELRKYPEDVIKQFLNRFYIVSEIEEEGIGIGGFSDGPNKMIFLSFKDSLTDYNLYMFKRSVHHEMGHLLYYHNHKKFKYWKWVLNSKGKYLDYSDDGGFEAIKQGKTSKVYDPTLFQLGYVCQYGQSHYLEDIATHCEILFLEPEVVKKYKQYRRARNKLKAMMKYYKAINPHFSFENVF